VPFKPSADAARLRASVERRGIIRLYHYTASINLRSILAHGAVYSRAQMNARGIAFTGHGWGRAGKDEELSDYICCSFVPHWGMISRETETQAVLAFRADLVWRAGTLFCPGNSASNEFDINTLTADTTVNAFDALFDNPNGSWPRPYQCEVLVRDEIPLDSLIRVNFQSVADQEAALEQVKHLRVPAGQETVTFAVSPGLYPPKRP
jgi:hypothetical protein